MDCLYCESKNAIKIGYSIFEDVFFCEDCEEEFELERDEATDPKEWEN